MNVKVMLLDSNAVMPEFKTNGAAGFDIAVTESTEIQPGTAAVISTGLAFEIPDGYELEIRTRSGHGFKHNLMCFNGTIDSDYRGEVKLKIWNLGSAPFKVNSKDRMAQGIIKKIENVRFYEMNTLSETARGDKGFGSTNIDNKSRKEDFCD